MLLEQQRKYHGCLTWIAEKYIEPVKDISDKTNQNIFWELGILLFLVYVKRNS